MNTGLTWLGGALARFLSRPLASYRPIATSSFEALDATLRCGDVLLVEGDTRIAVAIKYLTQSTWSHAALCLGRQAFGGRDFGCDVTALCQEGSGARIHARRGKEPPALGRRSGLPGDSKAGSAQTRNHQAAYCRSQSNAPRSSLFINGILATRELLEELVEAGSTDVAFHVDLSQGRKGFATESDLNELRERYIERARGLPLSVFFNTTVFDGNLDGVGGRLHDAFADRSFVRLFMRRTADMRIPRNTRGVAIRAFARAVASRPDLWWASLRWLAATLWRARRDLVASRGRINKISFFVHNFMDASELDPERLHACVFEVATQDGPISMCSYNASRDEYLLRPLALGDGSTWNPTRCCSGSESSPAAVYPIKFLKGRSRQAALPDRVNCSAVSCPILPRRPFAAQDLQQALDREARRFFASADHLRIDRANTVVYLSEILRFYREDFVSEAVSLVGFVNRYAPHETPEDFEVRFIPYDWTIANARAKLKSWSSHAVPDD